MGIDQNQAAIGMELAEDLCAHATGDPGQHQAGGTGLLNSDPFAGADVEAAPVPGSAIAALLDQQRRGIGLADADHTALDHQAIRQGERLTRNQAHSDDHQGQALQTGQPVSSIHSLCFLHSTNHSGTSR